MELVAIISDPRSVVLERDKELNGFNTSSSGLGRGGTFPWKRWLLKLVLEISLWIGEMKSVVHTSETAEALTLGKEDCRESQLCSTNGVSHCAQNNDAATQNVKEVCEVLLLFFFFFPLYSTNLPLLSDSLLQPLSLYTSSRRFPTSSRLGLYISSALPGTSLVWLITASSTLQIAQRISPQ